MESRVCNGTYCLSVSGMVIAGFFAFMLGIILCLVNTSLGTGMMYSGLAALTGAALIAGATAMSKPEEVVECAEIDWSAHDRFEPHHDSSNLKRIALVVVYRTIGKTVEERRATYISLAIGLAWTLICLAIQWPRKGH